MPGGFDWRNMLEKSEILRRFCRFLADFSEKVVKAQWGLNGSQTTQNFEVREKFLILLV